jgi:hypothetical protein
VQIGHNLTEEYTLLFQFAALYIFWRSLNSQRALHCFFLLGLTMGAAFLLRPNNIGTHLSIIIYQVLSGVLSKDWGRSSRKIAVLLAGFFAVLGITAVYFTYHNAFGDLVDQMFIFNMKYANASGEDRLISTLAVLFASVSFSVVVVVLTTWILGWRQVIGKQQTLDAQRVLLLVALIGLPVETVLAGFSGWVYAHYAMALLPVIAVLVAFFLHGLSSNLKHRSPVINYGVLLIVLIWTTYKPVSQMYTDLSGRQSDETLQLLADVQSAAADHDYLIFWGAETTHNFLVGKNAPSRYVYQYPLFTADYVTSAMVEEFLAGIVRERPLIIDTSLTNPNVPPLNEAERTAWMTRQNSRRQIYSDKNMPHLQPVFSYIQNNYTIVDAIGPEKWPVYAFTGS